MKTTPPTRDRDRETEPVLPRLLVLEIGSRPERPRASRPSRFVLVTSLGLVVGLGLAGGCVVWLVLSVLVWPMKTAPGTPSDGLVLPAPVPVTKTELLAMPVPDGEPEEPEEPEEVPVPKPPATRRPPKPASPFGTPPAPAGTPGRLVVEGDAVVELQGEFGGFRAGTPLPPGDYAVWADFGDGLVDTGSKVAAGAGRTVTVICLPEQRLCSLMP